MKLKRRLAFFSVMLVISVFLVSVSSCKGDGGVDLVVEDWMGEIPKGKTIIAFDISGNYSIDPESKANIPVKNWTSVAVYIWGGAIGDDGWGKWPGHKLTNKVSGNSNIFWAEVPAGKVGDGHFIFNNALTTNTEETKLVDVPSVVEEGNRYLFRNGELQQF